ncbi:hypothetical protein V2K54_00820 [Pseudomonas alliivorans]|nr:hypothetical protein [Pseudomonas alliivorans]
MSIELCDGPGHPMNVQIHTTRETAMHIPARFEFHYVQNGVKKSVTILTERLFKKPETLLNGPAPAVMVQKQRRVR